ncbi:MAG: glucose 1-dehydrogenase [Methylobacter sp.]|nr:MAG: glucose 1-dehydrogenase [Methylobacter sp.]PPD25217.1 MAG: glucose 1-dehydrogenase [Methylomonas sp.]
MAAVKTALVAGVGPKLGLGAALARRFAAEGLTVIIAGRSPDKLSLVADDINAGGGQVIAVPADATDEDGIRRIFQAATAEGMRLDIAVYNVDSNQSAPLLDTTLEHFTALWRQNTLGAFLFAREAARSMLPQGRGTVIFTGATASMRARPPFTGFAAAKAGVRAIAQGMAREFGPRGLHVAHVVIDGVIDGDRARRQFSQYVDSKGKDGLLHPDAIAESYWHLHNQHPSAWSHEIDLRPFKEPF